MMTVYYDLGDGPVTFDAAHFLAYADYRRRLTGDETMRVIFVPAEGDGFRHISVRDKQFDYERKYSRLWNVLVPLARLVPSVAGIEVLANRSDMQRVIAETPTDRLFPPQGVRCPYFFGYIARLAAKGADPRCFKARSAPPAGDYATITLRRSDFQPDRNSDLTVFGEVADYLQSLGLKVWCVPDTEFPDDHGRLDPHWRAAFDLDARMALYEGAKINVMSSTGPTALPTYGLTNPKYVMGPIMLGKHYTTSEAYYIQHDMPLDRDFTFAAPGQRLLWRDGSTETFIATIKEILGEKS